MATYQAVEPDELKADSSRPYAEFLPRPGMPMGGLPPPRRRQGSPAPTRRRRGLRGAGRPRRARGRRRAHRPRAGRVVSVDIGADHHFVDVTEDPSVLVVFAPD